MKRAKHLTQSLVPSSCLINISSCSESLASACPAPAVGGWPSGIFSLGTFFLQQRKVLSESAHNRSGQMILFRFLLKAGPQPACRQLWLGRREPVAKCRRGLLLPWLCLPVNVHPVFCCASPRPSSPDIIFPLPQCRHLEGPTPSPHQQPNELPKAWPARHGPPVLTAQDPAGICRECASWAGAQL